MPLSEAERSQRVAAALEAHNPAQDEQISLIWRGERRTFPVVSLDLEATVLNPASHRIRSELESHDRAEVVERDPTSDEAQDVIRQVLRDLTPNFEQLMTNLGEEGQQAPGVITRSGLLVNANRRAVALHDIAERYIRVAVLPPDATAVEIADLELRLQMQADFREDYSYTNRLLFEAELINVQNRPAEEVARALNIAASSDARALRQGRNQVEQDLRVLALIRELQRRSNGRLKLTAFDNQEIALEELDQRYRELQRTNPGRAKRLHELRLLGVLSDVPYRAIRELEVEALEEQVLPIMSEDELLGGSVELLTQGDAAGNSDTDPEGLDVLKQPVADTDGGPTVTPMVDLLATTAGADDIELPTPEGPRRVARDDVVDALRRVLVDAADDRRRLRSGQDRLRAPANLALEAERKLRSALETYGSVSAEAGFDPTRLVGALTRIGETLHGFEEALGEELC
jgi:hypothetical protein